MTRKSILTGFIASMCASVCLAQSNTYPFPASGSVGIGTTSPVGKLDIADSRTLGSKYNPSQSLIRLQDGSSAEMLLDGNEIYANNGIHIGTTYSHPIKFRKVNTTQFVDLMTLTPGGFLGIGTVSPSTKVHLTGPDTKFITLTRDGLGKNGHIGYGTANNGGIYLGTDDNPYVLWAQQNGRVGIGTTNPQATLAVEGNILAKEVKVKTNIAVPDYVFEPDYELPTLTDVETFVKKYKHLPEVPSAGDIARQGLDVAEMNLLLLKKVEELTLYILEQQREINQLKEKTKNL